MRSTTSVRVGLGIAAGLFLTLSTGQGGNASTNSLPHVSKSGAAASTIAFTCPSGKSVGTMVDYFDGRGLSLDDALSEGKRVILRGRSSIVESSAGRQIDKGKIVVTFVDSAERPVGMVRLARVAAGWRLDGGSRCVS